MNIQDFLNRYKGKQVNLIITNMEIKCNSHSIEVIATSGFGLEVRFNVPIESDLNTLCLPKGFKNE